MGGPRDNLFAWRRGSTGKLTHRIRVRELPKNRPQAPPPPSREIHIWTIIHLAKIDGRGVPILNFQVEMFKICAKSLEEDRV